MNSWASVANEQCREIDERANMGDEVEEELEQEIMHGTWTEIRSGGCQSAYTAHIGNLMPLQSSKFPPCYAVLHIFPWDRLGGDAIL